MFKALLIAGVILLSFTGAAFAQSGIAKQSSSVFNSMVNTTNPKVVMGARRGVITGGGLTVKNRMMNVQLLSATAPSVTAGCGGIDAFMGSFSFISKDQLVAALRAVASAAVGYAFKLALQSMCPSCESQMSKLQDKMDLLTSGSINSCEMGEALIEAGGDNSIAEGIGRMGGPIREATGTEDDYQAARRQNKKARPLGALAEQQPDLYTEVMSGNIIWQALKAQNAGSWLGNADDAMLEDIMSLTGIIIVCLPPGEGSSQHDCQVDGAAGSRVGQTGNAITYRQGATLSLKELVEGSDSERGVKRMHCIGMDAHQPKGCNRVEVLEYADFEGLRSKVLKIMIGDGSANSGMIQAVYDGQREPTSAEQKLIYGGGQYAQLAINLAIRSPEASTQFTIAFADLIAAELAQRIVFVNLNAALSALSPRTGVKADTKEIRELVMESMRKNQGDLQQYYERAKGKSAVLDYYKGISSVMESRAPAQRPIGATN